ncbi:MAG: TasA family protein [Coriobacteriia bacterium]|nr:TasA family protein [Coriobacteriia bacterium]
MKRVLIYAAIVAAMLSMGGARAYFTAQTEVKDSVITAGMVAISAEPTSAPLTIDALAPGETVSRTIEVRNTGSLGFDAVTSAAKKAGITDFWNALQCRVTCAGSELYNGPLSAMRTAPVRVGAGGSATLTYAITLPADAGNDLQGDYVKASVYIDAEQTH